LSGNLNILAGSVSALDGLILALGRVAGSCAASERASVTM
jgi:hypothetical protein